MKGLVHYTGQAFASPEEALAHFGIKGMRWGIRKERESFETFGSPYSSRNGQGHGSALYELKKSDKLVVDSSKGYHDVRPKNGYRSPLVKTRHDEMSSALEEMRELYPSIKKLDVEIVPMSHTPGLEPFLWGKVPAAAIHNQDGEARLIYNDRQKKINRSNLKQYESLQPGAATIPGFLGRHEMGHILAIAGNLSPPSWESAHGSYAQKVAYAQDSNFR